MHKQQLEIRYPEFAATMHDYYNTMLLQNLENKILKEASNNHLGLEKQFKRNKERYTIQGFEGLIIYFTDMRARQKLEYEIKSMDLDINILEDKLSTFGDLLEVEKVRVRKGENEIVDHFIWKQSPFKKHYSLIIIEGDCIKLPANKYEEAYSDVLLDYMIDYEKEYIQKLKKKYKLIID